MTFIVISIIGAIALVGIIIFVPMQRETVKSSVLNELKILKRSVYG